MKAQYLLQRKLFFALCLSCTLSAMLARASNYDRRARQILDASGIQGGLIVHIGCGDGKLTAALRANESYLVHGLDADGVDVAKARVYIRSKNLYGPVSAAKYNGKTLPYGDNIVNLIVADTLGNVSTEEAMRVLTPLGAVVVGGRKTVKPWPEDIDDWPQYLNKADNNAVAKDSVAGPPRYVQWVDKP
ncbi:MAG: class I SAM-dependent methyltransferase, partial [Planctomycetota bacterium]